MLLIAFINFFALNLLTAALTDPMDDVAEQGNLHDEVLTAMDRPPPQPWSRPDLALRDWGQRRGLVHLNILVWALGYRPLAETVPFTKVWTVDRVAGLVHMAFSPYTNQKGRASLRFLAATVPLLYR